MTFHIHFPVAAVTSPSPSLFARPARFTVDASCIEDTFDAIDRYVGGRGLQLVRKNWPPPGPAEPHVVAETPEQRAAAYEDLFRRLR